MVDLLIYAIVATSIDPTCVVNVVSQYILTHNIHYTYSQSESYKLDGCEENHELFERHFRPQIVFWW